jgi:AcrR family transcriptional regulator
VSKGEQTRQRVLDCAVGMASRQGLEGLSIGNLASELGLSKSGLFAHFGSKEELQVAVLSAASERFEAQIIKPALKRARGEARLRELFDRWLGWIAESNAAGGCLFMAAAVELDDREGKARDYLVGAQRQLVELLAGLARTAIEQGQFRKDLDCEAFAFELFGIALSYNHAKRLLRDRKADARARAAFARLLDWAHK